MKFRFVIILLVILFVLPVLVISPNNADEFVDLGDGKLHIVHFLTNLVSSGFDPTNIAFLNNSQTFTNNNIFNNNLNVTNGQLNVNVNTSVPVFQVSPVGWSSFGNVSPSGPNTVIMSPMSVNQANPQILDLTPSGWIPLSNGLTFSYLFAGGSINIQNWTSGTIQGLNFQPTIQTAGGIIPRINAGRFAMSIGGGTNVTQENFFDMFGFGSGNGPTANYSRGIFGEQLAAQGNIQNAYWIWLNHVCTVCTVSNAYGIYQNAFQDRNYFLGQTAIGENQTWNNTATFEVNGTVNVTGNGTFGDLNINSTNITSPVTYLWANGTASPAITSTSFSVTFSNNMTDDNYFVQVEWTGSTVFTSWDITLKNNTGFTVTFPALSGAQTARWFAVRFGY